MRSTLVLCGGGGGGGGEEQGLRARVWRMKRLLWLRPARRVDAQADADTGVWLRSFQLLDTESFSGDPVQEWGEEMEDGAVFGITLRREPVLPASSDPAMDNTPPHEAPSVFTFAQYHTVKVRRMKAATLERLIDHLLDPEHQEADFTRVFLSTYRAFTCPSALIQLLFQRDDMMANLDNSVCPRSTLIPVIRLWLDEHGEDFRRPPQHQALRLLCAHLRHRLCFRRLATTADTLLKRLKEDDRRADLSSNSDHPRGEGREEEEEEKEEGRGETSSEEEPVDFMHFSKKEVAEQLTRLDAELFGRVEPFQCVGCVWSQRDKKDKVHLAPTVRATIAQFNAVTNSVITSLLLPSSSPTHAVLAPCSSSPPSSSSPASGSPRSPTHHASPARRARVIERWIAIAQDCRQLRNFSSLRAVLSALQSNAVYRLKKTWAAVGRESMTAFDHLCETFPDENCTLTSREILVESYSGGVVPYLGTYLTVLTMLDTALPDTVEGGLINFEKRRREFEILSQIRQLQVSSSQYSLPDRPHISAWLGGQRMLTDQESYDLSRTLEPPGDSCPSSPSAWSHRALTKKLTSLLTVSDGASRKSPSADQISVSSSGSSGSEMEDLSSPQPSPLRLKLKSFGSLQNVAEDFTPTSPGRSSTSSSSSPAPSAKLHHRSSSGAATSPEPAPSPSCHSLSPQACLPLYNRQVCDSCIVRVSVESGNNGNVYKSILLTSQDHTPQVIQRALEKHNLEGMSYQDFTLSQVLAHDKELQVPDNANVFYAMSTQANYDFILRQRWRSHFRRPFALAPSSSSSSSSSTSSSSSSPGALARGRHGLAK